MQIVDISNVSTHHSNTYSTDTYMEYLLYKIEWQYPELLTAIEDQFSNSPGEMRVAHRAIRLQIFQDCSSLTSLDTSKTPLKIDHAAFCLTMNALHWLHKHVCLGLFNAPWIDMFN